MVLQLRKLWTLGRCKSCTHADTNLSKLVVSRTVRIYRTKEICQTNLQLSVSITHSPVHSSIPRLALDHQRRAIASPGTGSKIKSCQVIGAKTFPMTLAGKAEEIISQKWRKELKNRWSMMTPMTGSVIQEMYEIVEPNETLGIEQGPPKKSHSGKLSRIAVNNFAHRLRLPHFWSVWATITIITIPAQNTMNGHLTRDGRANLTVVLAPSQGIATDMDLSEIMIENETDIDIIEEMN